MKVLRSFLCLFLIFSSLFYYSFDEANAAKKPLGKIKIIDGKEVSYDDNFINGSVDSTPKDKVLDISLVEDSKLSSPRASLITTMLNSLKLKQYNVVTVENLLAEKNIDSYVDIINLLNEEVAESSFKFRTSFYSNDNDHDFIVLENNIKTAINYGNPILINIREGIGDIYFRNHNFGMEVNNIIILTGYENYGKSIFYLDIGDRFSGFSQKKEVSNYTLYGALKGEYYVW